MIIYKDESYKIMGVCFKVHSELGCGFYEKIYHEALERELKEQGIPFEHEKKITISYREEPLRKHFIADFVCFDKILLEIKSCKELNDAHMAQILNYLKATKLRLGILINFGTPSLTYRRVVTNYTNFIE